MNTDYENSESDHTDNLLDALGVDPWDREAFLAFLSDVECTPLDDATTGTVDAYRESYRGEHSDWEVFAMSEWEELYSHDFPALPMGYELIASDPVAWACDYTFVDTDNGTVHVFSNAY